MTLKSFALSTLAFAAIHGLAEADTIVLQGGSTSAITYVRSDNAGNNYGGDATLIIGKTVTPAVIRGLLSYDLSGIPAGSTITSITLSLVSTGTGSSTNQSGSVALNLYDLTGNFTEGTGGSNGAVQTNTATWNTRDASGAWTTPGGDYTTLLTSGNADPSTNSAGTSLLFASTTAFVSAAQSSLNTATPFTLLLKLNDTSESENLRRAFFFVSDEPTGTAPSVAANAPKLTIQYVPEPATAGLLLVGIAGMVSRRRKNSRG